MVGFGSARFHEGLDNPYAAMGPRYRPGSAGAASGSAVTSGTVAPTPVIDPPDRVTLSPEATVPGGDSALLPMVGGGPAAGTTAAPAADSTVGKAKEEGVHDETEFRIYRVLMERGMTRSPEWNVSVDNNKPAVRAALEKAFKDGVLTRPEWEEITRSMTGSSWNAFTGGTGVIRGEAQLAIALEAWERNLDVLNLEHWQLAENEAVTLAAANDLAPLLKDKFDHGKLNVPFRAVFQNARSEAENTIRRQRAAVLMMRGMDKDDIDEIREFMEKEATLLLIDQAAAARIQHKITYTLSQKSIDVEIDLSDPLVFELYTKPGGLFEQAVTGKIFPEKDVWKAFGAKAARVKAFRAWVEDSSHPERKRELGGLLADLEGKQFKGTADWMENVLANFDRVAPSVTRDALIEALSNLTPVIKRTV